MDEAFELMHGKLHVYKRPGSRLWQCSAYLAGKNRRRSTGQTDRERAAYVAEEWYVGLRGKAANGEGLHSGKKFKEVAAKFIEEFEVITAGERNPRYVSNHRARIKNHLNPFFGDLFVTEITSGLVQEYRVHRIRTNTEFKTNKPKPLARSTLHQEIVCLRQILTVAEAHGWIKAVPTVTPRYKASGKVTRRAWFTPAEYKRLRDATRDRAANPGRERYRPHWELLHDFVLFMVNTGLRPDEALRLEFRDVAIVEDAATEEQILEIEIHKGKRGVGFCKSMPGAVLPFKRIKERRERTLRAEAMAAGNPAKAIALENGAERLFPFSLNNLLNIILRQLNLKHDREGQVRTAYSLRHTYICLRLMEGADIYQIAKNCRTSVDMIEKFYAAHIKDRIDTRAINVRKEKKPVRGRTNNEEGARNKGIAP
ncbi:tyrosine-type recombinase/integrase [Asticcacaulis excentricus]|uniref:Integrase family protein n=1 Tax=Asticcacaulis excentricus (strain ATCC 15261 / DSM 4724 / KCTC 12464 / NCIMB 9791 / VKM B-1370 / CB 48) TaxID=573065 RepID=E8RPY4_ASTEC|nr:phage integrase SAM-like domain-containing protein [Asticcacaulis excentricus]ADU13157.1 integrase family protein [Asticcacaulis excentricus CB 48]